MIELKFWNSNFLESVGIKFETNHCTWPTLIPEIIEIFEKAVTHKTMMRLKTWRMTNDGLNNLEYGVREIIKNRLFTKLMIESRLLVPQKISISDVDSGDSLIFIGKIIWFRLQKKTILIKNLEYDSTGLQKDENCEMLKIENAKIQSSKLENQDSDLHLDDLCLELGKLYSWFERSSSPKFVIYLVPSRPEDELGRGPSQDVRRILWIPDCQTLGVFLDQILCSSIIGTFSFSNGIISFRFFGFNLCRSRNICAFWPDRFSSFTTKLIYKFHLRLF